MAGQGFHRGVRISIVSDNPPDEPSVSCRRFLGGVDGGVGGGEYWVFEALAQRTPQVRPWRLRLSSLLEMQTQNIEPWACACLIQISSGPKIRCLGRQVVVFLKLWH